MTWSDNLFWGVGGWGGGRSYFYSRVKRSTFFFIKKTPKLEVTYIAILIVFVALMLTASVLVYRKTSPWKYKQQGEEARRAPCTWPRSCLHSVFIQHARYRATEQPSCFGIFFFRQFIKLLLMFARLISTPPYYSPRHSLRTAPHPPRREDVSY